MSRYNACMTHDRIDEILEQWQRESPQLDVSALAVTGRVMRIARLLEKHRETVLTEYGLNVWSFDVLATLRRQGSPYQLKPTDLYGLLMLSSGAMTNRIDRLEEDGVVDAGGQHRFHHLAGTGRAAGMQQHLARAIGIVRWLSVMPVPAPGRSPAAGAVARPGPGRRPGC